MYQNYMDVKITDGFWKKTVDKVSGTTVDAVYKTFEETGRIAAMACKWKEGEPKKPHYFWDSDVAKWIESAAYVYAVTGNRGPLDKAEKIIDDIAAAQQPDGYYNVYFTVCEPDKRFTNRYWHELYCAGHLMEAAVAVKNATGSDKLMNVMSRYTDLIIRTFMTGHTAPFTTPGHEEIELALYKMYKTTGDRKYYDLMKYFLDRRGRSDSGEDLDRSIQSHMPVREMREAIGHCVRAMYLYSAMADLALESGDNELFTACRALYEDVTKRKMYITGGIGSTRYGEAFSAAYDLPNNTAYTETCASIGLMLFCDRMFRADPRHPSEYADIIETEMYNGALSGLSTDGTRFFYENPLEIYLAERHRLISTNDTERFPITQRPEVFGCSCCPPNLTRTYTSIGQYFYTLDDSGAVYVHQFGTSSFSHGCAHVEQLTDYPNNGGVTVRSNCPVYIRIPGWCRGFTADRPYTEANGYARFEAGETNVSFDMTPYLCASSVRVVRNIGKAALRRGPVIYCAEAVSNGGSVHDLGFDPDGIGGITACRDEALGLDILSVPGFRRTDSVPDGVLYAPYEKSLVPVRISMIPYHAWANRGESDMLVYFPVC